MRGMVVIGLAMLATTGARADDRDAEFTAAAMKCWNRPDVEGQMPKIVWKVEIDASGLIVDITAETPRPKSRAAVESLRRAVMRCAPYRIPAGVYRITIDENTKGGKSLNPYK